MAPTGHAKSIQTSRKGPSLKELEVFTRQLALMTRAGIPILAALSILKQQVKTSRFKASLNRLEESIIDGGSIALGMSHERTCFPKFYSTLTAAGERAGILDQVLDTIADELKSRRILKARIARAAIYPAVVIATLAAIVTFLLVCVVPTFEDLFNESGVALPWLTQKIISLSRSITSAWLPLIAVPLLALSLLFSQARRSPWLTETRALLTSRIPIWRSLTGAKLACECSSLLASLTRVGIPILEALTITSETIESSPVKNDLKRICSEIIEGSSLSQAFRSSRYFPELLSNLIEAGESSGQLETMLSKAASLYREELEQSFELLKQLIEPALVLAIGAVVGTVVLAIYLPIFQIGDLSGATNLSQQ
jgi:type IV pilus assembly protein PilC